MTNPAEWIRSEAVEKVRAATEEVILDLSGVERIDAGAVAALDELAGLAEERSVKVVLRGVHGDVYKVLKLLRLSERFGFLN